MSGGSREDAAERQRGCGLSLPDLAEIFDQRQTVLTPGESTFMDTDAEVGGAAGERGHDVREHDLLQCALIRMKKFV